MQTCLLRSAKLISMRNYSTDKSTVVFSPLKRGQRGFRIKLTPCLTARFVRKTLREFIEEEEEEEEEEGKKKHAKAFFQLLEK